MLLLFLYLQIVGLPRSRFGIRVGCYDVDFLVINGENTILHPLLRLILSTNLLRIYSISLNNGLLFGLGHLSENHMLRSLLLLLDRGIRLLIYLRSLYRVDSTGILLHTETLFRRLLRTKAHHLLGGDLL